MSPPRLAECEDECLGAGLEERDLHCPFAHRVVLAHELVKAAAGEQAVPILVDILQEITTRLRGR